YVHVHDVNVGGIYKETSFPGAGFLVLGHGSGLVPKEIADSFTISDSMVSFCRNGVACIGADAQAGHIERVDGFQCSQWAFMDLSQAGNAWLGLKCDGGYGAISYTSAVFGFSYTEEGTMHSYGEYTTVLGGAVDFGGHTYSDKLNRIQIGDHDQV